jgi:Domain of unknown function (DUF4136)
MKSFTTPLAAAALLAVAGCASVQVNTQYDQSFSFSSLKTFHAKIATPWGNPIGEQNVLQNIQSGLQAKGWQLVPEDQADAEVLINGASQQKHDLNTFYTGMGGGWGWRGFGGMGMGTATTTTSSYTVGTLVVDIYDTKTKQLVWRGTASDEVKSKQEQREKQVSQAAEKLFKEFPPEPNN